MHWHLKRPILNQIDAFGFLPDFIDYVAVVYFYWLEEKEKFLELARGHTPENPKFLQESCSNLQVPFNCFVYNPIVSRVAKAQKFCLFV